MKVYCKCGTELTWLGLNTLKSAKPLGIEFAPCANCLHNQYLKGWSNGYTAAKEDDDEQQ
jgi:hypothetical protein